MTRKSAISIAILILVALLILTLFVSYISTKKTKLALHTYGAAEQPYDKHFSEAPAVRRHIAVSHFVTLKTPENKFSEAWRSAIKRCQDLGCEILSTDIQRESDYSPLPFAALKLRIAPAKETEYIEYLSEIGDITTHQTESIDKTEVVIDTEAKIRNLSSLRDRLRTMLKTQSGSLADVLAIERELSTTQAELDGLTAMRKVLADETEKVFMEVHFQSKSSVISKDNFAPVVRALRDTSSVFGESLAVLITVVTVIAPWIIIIVPGIWIVAKILRKRHKED